MGLFSQINQRLRSLLRTSKILFFGLAVCSGLVTCLAGSASAQGGLPVVGVDVSSTAWVELKPFGPPAPRPSTYGLPDELRVRSHRANGVCVIEIEVVPGASYFLQGELGESGTCWFETVTIHGWFKSSSPTTMLSIGGYPTSNGRPSSFYWSN